MNGDVERPAGAGEHAAESPVRATPSPVLSTGARRPERRSRYARKFQAAIVALVVAGLVSLAVAALLGTSGAKRAAARSDWSAWRPSHDGLAGAQEIADFVSPYYRASSASQLAVVTTINLGTGSSTNAAVQVAVPSQGAPGSLQALPAGSTVAYDLCGIGSTNCAIGIGQASSNRLLLLRREALELALYTFKYISGTQTVVAVLPPGHSGRGCTGLCPQPPTSRGGRPVNFALAFDRAELQPLLDRPLRRTLPEDLPPTVAQMQAAPEAELVSVITAHGLFSQQIEHAQDGSSVIVLSPLPSQ